MNGDPIPGRAGTQSRISGPILRHTSGPSSQPSGPIAGFLPWIEEAKEAPRPPPPLPGGGLPVCTGPNFEKEKKKSDCSNFSGSRFFSIASTLRGQSSALASNDAVQSYSQFVVFV